MYARGGTHHAFPFPSISIPIRPLFLFLFLLTYSSSIYRFQDTIIVGHKANHRDPDLDRRAIANANANASIILCDEHSELLITGTVRGGFLSSKNISSNASNPHAFCRVQGTRLSFGRATGV